MKIAVMGCGYWGKNLVRNMAELGALACVCDTRRELAEQLAEQYHVPVYSLEQISASDIDGVMIAAPAKDHYALAYDMLMSGKHVFVEKPIALNVEEAKSLCTLAAQKNRTLMVGHLLQYHPAFLKLKALIAEGLLGRIHYLYSNRLNLGKFRQEENILWSFAPHDISMILSIAGGLPDSVYATGSCHLNPHIHDVTTTHLSFRNNLQAHVFVSWLHPFKEQKLVVVGDRGMAVFDDGLPWKEKLQLYPHQVNWINGLPEPNKAEATFVPLETSEPLRLECEHFITCIQQAQKPRTDGAEGLNVLRVLDAAQRSLERRAPVIMREDTPPYFKHDTAFVDPGVVIGQGSKIWHFSHLLKGTVIGRDCVIGQNVMIGPDVVMGDRCKVQNNVSLYKGVILEDDVFCGPSCVFTNVHNPRAHIERKDEFRKTHVEQGVSIGANATIVCGVRLGAYSFIGAGAVITKDVPPHAVMVGNPARRIGWMSHAGEKLDHTLVCPREGRRYRLNAEGQLEAIEPYHQHEKINR